MLLTPPLFGFGAVEDISTWTDAGGVAVLGGQADPFGGTGAFRLTSTVTAAERYRAVVVTRNGRHFVAVFVKAGTAVGSPLLTWWDETAIAFRYTLQLNFSGGVLNSITALIGSGVNGHCSVGGGWYLVLMGTDNIIAAITNRFNIQPDPAGNGTFFVYQRSVVVCGHPLDSAVAVPGYAPGFERAEAPDGSFDAWRTAVRSRLQGEMGWVDGPPTMDPLHSGVDGAREGIGINNGWDAFLRAAWEGEPVLFCPDRAAASTNVPVSLMRPTPEERPAVEQTDGSKRFTLELQAASADAFRGY